MSLLRPSFRSLELYSDTIGLLQPAATDNRVRARTTRKKLTISTDMVKHTGSVFNEETKRAREHATGLSRNYRSRTITTSFRSAFGLSIQERRESSSLLYSRREYDTTFYGLAIKAQSWLSIKMVA